LQRIFDWLQETADSVPMDHPILHTNT
jgi:hypothetical protein